MDRLLGSLGFVWLVASCATASRPAPVSAQAAALTSAPAPAPAPAPTPPDDVDVDNDVRAPLRARYDPSIGGAQRPSLGIVVKNNAAQPVDVSNLRVDLEAVREGVPFRCAKGVGPQIGDREPSVLAPGESFVFDRYLDCALPLVGAYAVSVAVRFGKGPARSARDVHAFTLTVAAPKNVEPREVEGVPGLWASMGSSNLIGGGVAQGHGRTLLTLVNATRKPIELPPIRLGYRVYRVGNPIPCEDVPVTLHTPAVLAPGDTYAEPIEISCLGLGVAGKYEIAARLVLPGDGEGNHEVALGRLRVDVTRDPTLVIPPIPRVPVGM